MEPAWRAMCHELDHVRHQLNDGSKRDSGQYARQQGR